ncbi:ArnT family glycosyltransferase [Kineococcus sp. TBRC 1896]|uniref:ArnT family glycosyltransferase n=1 Tax=Kineococcus mangrovi TaxID=1660183 RepID=A0ABV4I0W6_9ACTN
MSGTLTRLPVLEDGQPTVRWSRRLLAALVAVAVVALVARWWRRGSSFDVFVDEFVYEQLGRSVRGGGLPSLSDGVFFLHPPGFFYLLAGWEDLLGVPLAGDPVQAVVAARGLNAVLGAGTAVLVTLLVARYGARWGFAAGLLLAVEPFALRQNGRVLLDTAVVFWVLVGLLVLRPLAQDPRRGWRPVVGGLALGLAVLTKDKSVMLTVLPLLLLWWLRPRQRRWVPTALGACFAPYATYLVVVTATGDVELWADAKFGGLLRAVGADVTTGFTAPGAPSLLQQVLRQLADFGATYVLLAVGLVCSVLLLLRSRSDDLALLSLTHLGAFAMLAYSATAGTLEEHFLYYLLVPSVGVLFAYAAVVTELPPPRWAAGRHRREDRRARVSRGLADLVHRLPLSGGPLLVLTVLLIGLDGATYVRWHAVPDDGFTRVRDYLLENAPAGTGVIITQGTSEFVFGDRFDAGPYTGDEQRVQHGVRYLVVPWREVYQGYTYVTLPTVEDLVAQGRLVLSVPSRSYGEVALYRLDDPA